MGSFKINILFIMIGFVLGYIVLKLMYSKPKVVIRYPTINNIGNTTFVDDKGQCYKYYSVEVPCQNNLPK